MTKVIAQKLLPSHILWCVHERCIPHNYHDMGGRWCGFHLLGLVYSFFVFFPHSIFLVACTRVYTAIFYNGGDSNGLSHGRDKNGPKGWFYTSTIFLFIEVKDKQPTHSDFFEFSFLLVGQRRWWLFKSGWVRQPGTATWKRWVTFYSMTNVFQPEYGHLFLFHFFFSIVCLSFGGVRETVTTCLNIRHLYLRCLWLIQTDIYMNSNRKMIRKYRSIASEQSTFSIKKPYSFSFLVWSRESLQCRTDMTNNINPKPEELGWGCDFILNSENDVRILLILLYLMNRNDTYLLMRIIHDWHIKWNGTELNSFDSSYGKQPWMNE